MTSAWRQCLGSIGYSSELKKGSDYSNMIQERPMLQISSSYHIRRMFAEIYQCLTWEWSFSKKLIWHVYYAWCHRHTNQGAGSRKIYFPGNFCEKTRAIFSKKFKLSWGKLVTLFYISSSILITSVWDDINPVVSSSALSRLLTVVTSSVLRLKLETTQEMNGTFTKIHSNVYFIELA